MNVHHQSIYHGLVADESFIFSLIRALAAVFGGTNFCGAFQGAVAATEAAPRVATAVPVNCNNKAKNKTTVRSRVHLALAFDI